MKFLDSNDCRFPAKGRKLLKPLFLMLLYFHPVSEITFFSVCLLSAGVSYIGQAKHCGDQEKSRDQNDPPRACHQRFI